LGKAFVLELDLGSSFGKNKIFSNKGGAKIFYFEKKIVTQSLDHKN
jgi:hypothetical protein